MTARDEFRNYKNGRLRPKVGEHLEELKRFWRHEVLTLAKARKAVGYTEWPVPQYQRNSVFISYKAGVTSVDDRVQ